MSNAATETSATDTVTCYACTGAGRVDRPRAGAEFRKVRCPACGGAGRRPTATVARERAARGALRTCDRATTLRALHALLVPSHDNGWATSHYLDAQASGRGLVALIAQAPADVAARAVDAYVARFRGCARVRAGVLAAVADERRVRAAAGL